MLNALKLATRAQPLAVFSNPLPYNICLKSSQIKFRTLLTESGKQDEIKMADNKKPGVDQTTPKEGTMGSFGEGYATRSDEEGFGGIYGGNQDDEEKIVQGNAPGYDSKQGSEVKEKEKARNQPQAS